MIAGLFKYKSNATTYTTAYTQGNTNNLIRDTNNIPIVGTTAEDCIQEFANIWIPPLGNFATLEENSTNLTAGWRAGAFNFGDEYVHIAYQGPTYQFTVSMGFNKGTNLIQLNSSEWNNQSNYEQYIDFTYMMLKDGIRVIGLINPQDQSSSTQTNVPIARIFNIKSNGTIYNTVSITQPKTTIASMGPFVEMGRTYFGASKEGFILLSQKGGYCILYTDSFTVSDNVSVTTSSLNSSDARENCYNLCYDAFNKAWKWISNDREVSYVQLYTAGNWSVSHKTFSLLNNEGQIISIAYDDAGGFYLLYLEEGFNLIYTLDPYLPTTTKVIEQQTLLDLWNSGVYYVTTPTSSSYITDNKQQVWRNISKPEGPFKLYFVNGLLYMFGYLGEILVANFHLGTTLNSDGTSSLYANIWCSNRRALRSSSSGTTTPRSIHITMLGNFMMVLDMLDIGFYSTYVASTGISYTCAGEYASAT